MEFHELTEIFPMMSAEEYEALKADIKANGLYEPIWTYDGKIIDGRNRFNACREVGVAPKFREWSGNGSLVSFVVSLNLRRRHLTASQQACVAEEALPHYEAEAHEREYAGKTPVSYLTQGRSADLAAKDFGISGGYIREARKLKREAPEVHARVRAGEISIPEAKREVKKSEREAQRKAKATAGRTVDLPPALDLRPGDFREILKDIPDNSADLVFTDPPYGEEYLGLWRELAEVAARILKPGGLLVAYSGQEFLPRVFDILREHLTYSWFAGVYHTGGHIQIWKHKVWNQWKPVLIFTKGEEREHDWYLDMYHGVKGDKAAHDWAQGEAEAAYYIERLTDEGDFVIDPMCGSGTIPRAAFKLGRRALGIDLVETNIEIAKAEVLC